MTTNFNHIINDNIDMFDNSDCMGIAEAIELENAFIAEQEEEEEYTCFLPDGTPVSDYQFLAYLEDKLAKVAEENGEESEEFADLASFYSDVYKDINGFRPHGFGLRYHGRRGA